MCGVCGVFFRGVGCLCDMSFVLCEVCVFVLCVMFEVRFVCGVFVGVLSV